MTGSAVSGGNSRLFAILFVAFIMRLFLAATLPYIEVEEKEYIPLAQSISVEEGAWNLPIRGPHHAALPAYFIQAGGSLFGDHPLGYRFFGVVAGIFLIVAASELAGYWAGPAAKMWTCVLLSFNEYAICGSVLATDIAYYYLFAMLALYFFCRFLQEEASHHLFACGAMLGLGFLCRELIGLFIPIFFAFLASSRYRSWLKRKEPYFAFLLFLLIISPDIHWNITAKNGEQVRLADQLTRVGGIGFTPNYMLFYTRGIFRRLGWELIDVYEEVPLMNKVFFDGYEEYPTMNMVFGLLLLISVTIMTLKKRRDDPVGNLIMLTFWSILIFFLFIRPARSISPRLEDKIGWLWIDLTLLPAAILSGNFIAGLGNRWKIPVRVLAGAGILYAVARVLTAQSGAPLVWERF